jgi:putative redox protein
MVKTQSEPASFLTTVSTQFHRIPSDTVPDNGGSGAGFRPHELLEASLASCLNIWLRMYASKHGLPLASVETTVQLHKDREGEATFEYMIELKGDLTDAQRAKLLLIAETCPVRQTLSRQLKFHRSGEPE